MVTKNEENQKRIIQVEVKRSEHNHISFDGGITYQRVIIIPIAKLNFYHPEREAGLGVDYLA